MRLSASHGGISDEFTQQKVIFGICGHKIRQMTIDHCGIITKSFERINAIVYCTYDILLQTRSIPRSPRLAIIVIIIRGYNLR